MPRQRRLPLRHQQSLVLRPLLHRVRQPARRRQRRHVSWSSSPAHTEPAPATSARSTRINCRSSGRRTAQPSRLHCKLPSRPRSATTRTTWRHKSHVKGPACGSGDFQADFTTSRADSVVVSGTWTISTFFPGAAHPTTQLTAVIVDTTSGAAIAPSQLFVGSSLKTLAAATATATTAKLNAIGCTDEFSDGVAPTADNYVGTAVGRSGLLIGLSQGQVAAEACGTIDLAIPWTAVQSHLSSIGARLAATPLPVSVAVRHQCLADCVRQRTALCNDSAGRCARGHQADRQHAVPSSDRLHERVDATVLVARLSRHRVRRCRRAAGAIWSAHPRSRFGSASFPEAKHTPSSRF